MSEEKKDKDEVCTLDDERLEQATGGGKKCGPNCVNDRTGKYALANCSSCRCRAWCRNPSNPYNTFDKT